MDEGADHGLSAGAGSAPDRHEPAPARRRAAWRSTSRTTSTRTSPQEETLEAFAGLIRAGKVGAVGASNFTGEQLAEALELPRCEGLPRYEWVQNGFSLLDQGDRETVFPVCHEHGLGYTPFSPLAGGWLTGKYRRGEAPPAGSRMTLRPEPYVGYRTDSTSSTRSRRSSAMRADEASRWPGSPSPGSLARPELTAIVVGPGRRRPARPRPRGARHPVSPADEHH